MSRCADTTLNGFPSGLSNAAWGFRADPDNVADALGRLPHGFDPLAFLASHGLDLLALLSRRGPALFGFGALGFFHFGLGALDLLHDGLGLLVVERLQDRWQELLALVAHVLLERFSQPGHLAGELLTLLRGALQLGQSFAGLLIVVERIRHEVLRFLALSENRKEMLLLQSHLKLQLFLEL